MKLGAEDRKKLPILGVVGVLALGAIFYIYSQLSTPDAPPPAAPAIVTPAARLRATTTSAKTEPVAQLDPTLHPEAMLVTESLVYSGSGRNIFSAGSAPAVVISKPVASVRIPEPVTPVRPQQMGPPPPPPIDLKFFGTETSSTGARRAFLLHGEDVFLVASGDIVQRRFRVISIDARSILIEDIANANKQSLPLLAN